MSIASEITRLQTAKADIKSAIEAKGVTVPSNASIDTYDTYVSQISGGGGGETNYLKQYAKKSLSGAITSEQLGTNIGSSMAEYLLYGQNNITSVDLTGTGATKITNNFCKKCNNLSSVIVPSTVTDINGYFCAETNIAEFTIPSTVNKIGEYFLQKTKVTSMTIPSTIIFVGSDAFNSCASLTHVTYNAPTNDLPQAFCTGTNALALVDINSSVVNIKNYALARDRASIDLLEVVLRRTDGIVGVANAIGSTSFNAAFRNRQNIKIYVPSALIASYEANANWAAGITAGYLTIVALEGSQYE